MIRLLFDEIDEKGRPPFSPTGVNEALSFPDLVGCCKCGDAGGSTEPKAILRANAGTPFASREASYPISNPPAPVDRAAIATDLK